MEIEKALQELRKDKKRKFIQSVDLILNLQKFDARKEALNTFIQIPNPTEKKLCGFLTKRTALVDTITKEEFKKFRDIKEQKRLSKKYDFFIAAAPLMGDIATTFGRVLGPVGKMPSPQAGIMAIDNEANIKATIEKMKKSIRIRTKERSIKLSIGKEDMPDNKLKENILGAINALENALPRKKDNIKEALIKFTMTKAIKIRR